MVFHIKPVADVRAVSIDRQRLAFQRVENDQRNELFREMEWPVIVGAVGNDDRKAVRALPGCGEMIARGFRGGVWRRWVVRGCFFEKTIVPERAVYLVG
ncbi:hypothetical protein D3C80_1173260 [compost metagenome]